MILAGVAVALAGYITGLVGHEATHLAACKLLGVPVDRVSVAWNRVTVHYSPLRPQDDDVIRAAPVMLFVPLVVVGVRLVLQAPSLLRGLLFFGLVVGYLPRSESDWQPVRRWLAILSRN